MTLDIQETKVNDVFGIYFHGALTEDKKRFEFDRIGGNDITLRLSKRHLKLLIDDLTKLHEHMSD